jgi:putative membrane protein
MMWYWGGGGVHWWGWFIGFVLTVAFWAFIIFLFISLMRSFATRDHGHAPPGHDDPERTLARRFANGEIDEEEFHRRLDVLRSHGLTGKS